MGAPAFRREACVGDEESLVLFAQLLGACVQLVQRGRQLFECLVDQILIDAPRGAGALAQSRKTIQRQVGLMLQMRLHAFHGISFISSMTPRSSALRARG
jgi:hypothetical protein